LLTQYKVTVVLIRTIPVHVEMDDVLAWHYDSKGYFSVKSAYRVPGEVMRRNEQAGRAGGAEGSEGRGDF
jgi:hypothetical protein